MPGPANTLLIEGSFVELAEELAQYIDNIKKSEEGSGVQAEIAPTIAKLRESDQAEERPNEAQDKQRDQQRTEVLKGLVAASSVLNSAPEKEFTASYNLLIHLVQQSSAIDMFLPRICNHLSQPVASSAQFGPALAITILTTLFNTLPPSNHNRYHVFLALLNVIRATSSAQAFDALIPQLESNVPKWLNAWESDDEDARALYIAISDVAHASGNTSMRFRYLLHALETIPPASASEPESRELAIRTLTAALVNPTVFDFTPLTASDSIQQLRDSDSALFDLLEIFAADNYSAYLDAVKATPLDSISKEIAAAASALETKIRLLTLASLAANAHNRSVGYKVITEALQIPAEDVEIWVIDAIRVGLVEGKLSQLKQEFLVQRATYRVFAEKQWSEIQSRLMIWRRSLEGVLAVVKNEKEKFAREGITAAEGTNGYGDGGERRERRQGRRGQGQQQQQQQPREVDFVGGE